MLCTHYGSVTHINFSLENKKSLSRVGLKEKYKGLNHLAPVSKGVNESKRRQ